MVYWIDYLHINNIAFNLALHQSNGIDNFRCAVSGDFFLVFFFLFFFLFRSQTKCSVSAQMVHRQPPLLPTCVYSCQQRLTLFFLACFIAKMHFARLMAPRRPRSHLDLGMFAFSDLLALAQ